MPGIGSSLLQRSEFVYVRLARQDVGMFRFLLEAQDNLGIMSVVDKRTAWLKVLFAPGQRQEVLNFLDGIKEMLSIEIKELPALILKAS